MKSQVLSRLTAVDARKLLVPHEIVRDPIHHDISITLLERRIIDTPAFQRLRRLVQLGPTHLVYPGAMHTRFMHSLGTLFVADQLVCIADQNAATYNHKAIRSIDPYAHLLIRLFALLHDLAHIAFGHTLEDEGNLSPSQWKDPARADKWLGDRSDIATAIRKSMQEADISPEAAAAFIKDLRVYVTFHGTQAEQMKLENPFVIDIVGNTLCADLLDYIERDMFFCGVPDRGIDRVIRYIAVVNVIPANGADSECPEFMPTEDEARGKGRLVMLAYRREREHFARGGVKDVKKPDIVSEGVDLLRRRFILAEKVHFHRTKLAASAMLISAVGSASSFRVSETYDDTDETLLTRLLGDSNERTQRLARAYQERRLYRPVYRLQYMPEEDTNMRSKELWREMYPCYRDPKWRADKEAYLESASHFPPGSVAIYCPDREMNMKDFQMLVQSLPGEEIKPLENILDDTRQKEMAALNERFRQLWQALVLVDPDVLDVTQVLNQKVQDLSTLCVAIMRFENCIDGLTRTGDPLVQQLVRAACHEHKETTGEDVPLKVCEDVEAKMKAVARGVRAYDIDALRENAEKLLRAEMAARGPKEKRDGFHSTDT